MERMRIRALKRYHRWAATAVSEQWNGEARLTKKMLNYRTRARFVKARFKEWKHLFQAAIPPRAEGQDLMVDAWRIQLRNKNLKLMRHDEDCIRRHASITAKERTGKDEGD